MIDVGESHSFSSSEHLRRSAVGLVTFFSVLVHLRGHVTTRSLPTSTNFNYLLPSVHTVREFCKTLNANFYVVVIFLPYPSVIYILIFIWLMLIDWYSFNIHSVVCRLYHKMALILSCLRRTSCHRNNVHNQIGLTVSFLYVNSWQ